MRLLRRVSPFGVLTAFTCLMLAVGVLAFVSGDTARSEKYTFGACCALLGWSLGRVQ